MTQLDDFGVANKIQRWLIDFSYKLQNARIGAPNERPVINSVVTKSDCAQLRQAAGYMKTLVEERDGFAKDLKSLRESVWGVMEENKKLRADLTTIHGRKRLPDERAGVTRKFSVPRPNDSPLKLYVSANVYQDGKLGEVFLKSDKQGSLVSGMLDALALALSIGLQYGVPLTAFTSKLIGLRFEPAGFTGDTDYPSCTSVLDLLARWLKDRFDSQPEPQKEE